ncbi:MAG: phospho-N-acetylmuramoyl-pentapeptide-transferase [Planctomycetes bacterium RBG_13_63_9]|nr:MAG: phospho-N-acetylmuramoyl-pentapeptide-transferase [Planctomycetes bacterium RBG_13_63_9]
MLLWLLDRLAVFWPHAALSDGLAAFGKITFRASLAAMVAFLLAVLLGGRWIAWLKRHFREPNKSDSPQLCRLHRDKDSTPTMGGLFIVAGLIGGVILFGDLGNRHLQLALLVAAGLAAIGVVDDLVKLRRTANGISARTKLAAQLVVAAVAAVLLYQHHASLADGLELRLPLWGTSLSLGLWFIPLAILVIVGASNAVNLTDGLDGLAGGCLIFAIGAMTIVAYASGHAELAAYLNIPRIPDAGEMTVLAGGMVGGLLGFLWFNCHPAQVFMGDTGALPLGGLLGLLAVATRQELLLALVGGVFVVEAASVILQVGYFKWRRCRILLCAPLHHHFQFKGWAESKIVVRFWIASALCALLGMASLKLTVQDDASPRDARVTAAEAPLRR